MKIARALRAHLTNSAVQTRLGIKALHENIILAPISSQSVWLNHNLDYSLSTENLSSNKAIYEQTYQAQITLIEPDPDITTFIALEAECLQFIYSSTARGKSELLKIDFGYKYLGDTCNIIINLKLTERHYAKQALDGQIIIDGSRWKLV